MKSSLTILLQTLLVLGLTTVAAEKPDQPLPKGKKPALYSFVRQPEERTAEIGTFVAFACRVYPEANAMYKWYFTTTNSPMEIPGATNREYFIDAASVAKVGAYQVRVTWPDVTNAITSANTFLSVYRRSGENPITGTLTTSVTKFTSGGTWTCTTGGTVFDRIFVSTNYIFGPFVPVLDQSGLMINDGYHYNIKLDSISPANGTTPVGLRFTKNFSPPGALPLDLACLTGDCVTGPIVDIRGLSTDPSVNKARYKLTIYYRAPAPVSGVIEVNWKYY